MYKCEEAYVFLSTKHSIGFSSDKDQPKLTGESTFDTWTDLTRRVASGSNGVFFSLPLDKAKHNSNCEKTNDCIKA